MKGRSRAITQFIPPYFQVGFHVVWQVWIFAWAELFVLACLLSQSRIATWSKRKSGSGALGKIEGSKGGKAHTANMTPEGKSEQTRKGG
jgi:hypothetical protein